MSFVIPSQHPYKFDLDRNGIIALTESNVARIDFLLANDSSYRPRIKNGDVQTVKAFCARHPHLWMEPGQDNSLQVGLTEELVAIIDRANSTHQSSEGPHKGNKGRRKTAEFICSIPGFETRLFKRDSVLVEDIANNAISGRYTLSFASKFCAYVSRALFDDNDGYSIYDRTVRLSLPYFTHVYLGKAHRTYRGKCVTDPYWRFGTPCNNGDTEWHYGSYQKLIADLIDENELLTGYRITRRDLDHLLWYYFKGEPSHLEESRRLISSK